jgi:hypothetical protein
LHRSNGKDVQLASQIQRVTELTNTQVHLRKDVKRWPRAESKNEDKLLIRRQKANSEVLGDPQKDPRRGIRRWFVSGPFPNPLQIIRAPSPNIEALRLCHFRKKASVRELLEYAWLCRVERVMKAYTEALL